MSIISISRLWVFTRSRVTAIWGGIYGRIQNAPRSRPFWRICLQQPKSPAVNALVSGVLLSTTIPSDLENDIEPAVGKDLLTLRLEKLIERGAYKQAFEIYSSLETEPYHERLARAGVLAMLYNGEKSLACLETNTVSSRFPKILFWSALSTYCSRSLSETPPEDATKNTSFEKISPNGVLAQLISDQNYNFIYTSQAYEAFDHS